VFVCGRLPETVKGCTWYHNETSDQAASQKLTAGGRTVSKLELPPQELGGHQVPHHPRAPEIDKNINKIKHKYEYTHKYET
jgi:hypothetical protein